MIQKKRYGGFAAARRRVYAAASDPPALCGELRKEKTALCGQQRESTALCTDKKRIKIFKMILREEIIV